MQFQAPFDIVDMRKQRFLEQQAAQEQQQAQQQQYQKTLMGALGDVAGAYQKNQEMEAGVKAGEMFGKTFGKQFGFDSGVYNTPEYKKLPREAQYQFNQGITGNLGSLLQSFNFGQAAGQRSYAPAARQIITNQSNITRQGGPGVPMSGLPSPSLFGN
jgi:hypothetical protein